MYICPGHSSGASIYIPTEQLRKNASPFPQACVSSSNILGDKQVEGGRRGPPPPEFYKVSQLWMRLNKSLISENSTYLYV